MQHSEQTGATKMQRWVRGIGIVAVIGPWRIDWRIGSQGHWLQRRMAAKALPVLGSAGIDRRENFVDQIVILIPKLVF